MLQTQIRRLICLREDEIKSCTQHNTTLRDGFWTRHAAFAASTESPQTNGNSSRSGSFPLWGPPPCQISDSPFASRTKLCFSLRQADNRESELSRKQTVHESVIYCRKSSFFLCRHSCHKQLLRQINKQEVICFLLIMISVYYMYKPGVPGRVLAW